MENKNIYKEVIDIKVKKNYDYNYNELINLCRKFKRVYIIGHYNPDPDCIASSNSLKTLLNYFNIPCEIVKLGEIVKPNIVAMVNLFSIKMINKSKVIVDDDSLFIYCDCQRGEINTWNVESNNIACIDHHNVRTFEHNYLWHSIRSQCGACSSIIFDVYRQLNIELTDVESTQLYYGILIDTQSLTRGVSKVDKIAANGLCEIINEEWLKVITSNTMSVAELDLLGKFIENRTIYKNILISRSDNCEDNFLGSVGDYLINTSGISVVIIYSKQDRGIKFSVRCMLKSIKASDLITYILYGLGSGGGHDAIAGGLIPNENLVDFIGDISEYVMQRIVDYFKDIDTEDSIGAVNR